MIKLDYCCWPCFHCNIYQLIFLVSDQKQNFYKIWRALFWASNFIFKGVLFNLPSFMVSNSAASFYSNNCLSSKLPPIIIMSLVDMIIMYRETTWTHIWKWLNKFWFRSSIPSRSLPLIISSSHISQGKMTIFKDDHLKNTKWFASQQIMLKCWIALLNFFDPNARWLL